MKTFIITFFFMAVGLGQTMKVFNYDSLEVKGYFIFGDSAVNHENIQNIGTNSHTDIDNHISSSANPHTVTHSQLSDKGTNDHTAIDNHIASTSNPHTVTHSQLSDKGTNTHTTIDSHIDTDKNPHAVNTFLSLIQAVKNWTSFPSTDTDSGLGQLYIDMTNYNQARLTGYVYSAGSSGSYLQVQYYYSSTWNDLVSGGLGVDATGIQYTSWVNIPAGALGNKVLRIVGGGGDDATTVTFAQFNVQFK